MADKQQHKMPVEKVITEGRADFAEGLAKARAFGPVKYREKAGSAWGKMSLKYGILLMIIDRTPGGSLAGILLHTVAWRPLTMAYAHTGSELLPLNQVWELSHLWSLDVMAGFQLLTQVMRQLADAAPSPKLVVIDVANPNLVDSLKRLGFRISCQSRHPYLEQLDGSPLPITSMELSGPALEKLIATNKGRNRS